MHAMTAVNAEDEPVLRAELREMLAKVWPELIFHAEAQDGFEALQALAAQQHSLIRRPIKELIDELDPKLLSQIHRGTIVNVNAIAGVTHDIGGHLLVRLKGRNETLAVREPYGHLFKQM